MAQHRWCVAKDCVCRIEEQEHESRRLMNVVVLPLKAEFIRLRFQLIEQVRT